MTKATFESLSARNKVLNKWAQELSKGIDHYEDNEWQRGYNFAEVEFGDKLRRIMASLPKGFNREKPNLKNQAKEKFLQWKRNQAQAEWKKLPEEEQKRWEAYVAEGVEFGEIREREIAREAPFGIGDRVVLHHNIGYCGVHFPAGSAGKIAHIFIDPVKEEESFRVVFDDQRLDSLNTYAHEIRREA